MASCSFVVASVALELHADLFSYIWFNLLVYTYS